MQFLKRIYTRLFSNRRPFKLTKAGWVFILYTIGVGAGAINTGNNLLYLVFGVFLGMILASGFLSDLSLWGLSVEWTFPHTSQAGQPAAIFVYLTNHKKRAPSLSVSVAMEGRVKGMPVELKAYVPYVSTIERAPARLEFVPVTRGRFEVVGARLHTKFPFALLEKWWRVRRDEDDKQEFFITPARVLVTAFDLPSTLMNEASALESSERGDGPTFYGIRPFREGDNPKRIHWKSSAKRQDSLLLREMENENEFDVVVRCPSPQALRGWSVNDVEKLVSFLDSTLREFEASGHKSLLVIDGRVVTARDEFMAVWEPLSPIGAELEKYLSSRENDMLADSARLIDGLEAFSKWQRAS